MYLTTELTVSKLKSARSGRENNWKK